MSTKRGKTNRNGITIYQSLVSQGYAALAAFLILGGVYACNKKCDWEKQKKSCGENTEYVFNHSEDRTETSPKFVRVLPNGNIEETSYNTSESLRILVGKKKSSDTTHVGTCSSQMNEGDSCKPGEGEAFCDECIKEALKRRKIYE